MTHQAPDWHALQGVLEGAVVLPGSPGYESARKPAISRFHAATPQAIVLCETPEEVSEAISFAAAQGSRRRPAAGGTASRGAPRRRAS